jgi:hypothetical protein
VALHVQHHRTSKADINTNTATKKTKNTFSIKIQTEVTRTDKKDSHEKSEGYCTSGARKSLIWSEGSRIRPPILISSTKIRTVEHGTVIAEV